MPEVIIGQVFDGVLEVVDVFDASLVRHQHVRVRRADRVRLRRQQVVEQAHVQGLCTTTPTPVIQQLAHDSSENLAYE